MRTISSNTGSLEMNKVEPRSWGIRTIIVFHHLVNLVNLVLWVLGQTGALLWYNTAVALGQQDDREENDPAVEQQSLAIGLTGTIMALPLFVMAAWGLAHQQSYGVVCFLGGLFLFLSLAQFLSDFGFLSREGQYSTYDTDNIQSFAACVYLGLCRMGKLVSVSKGKIGTLMVATGRSGESRIRHHCRNKKVVLLYRFMRTVTTTSKEPNLEATPIYSAKNCG